MEQKNNYQICNRCVMDTSDPGILFDEKGNCNHCNQFLSVRINKIHEKKINSLENYFEKIKSRRQNKSDYDAVCGISGGADSSYALHLACKHGLKIVGVHVDNGWNSSTSVKNIFKLVNALKIDYKSYVLPWKKYQNVQKAFLKASVPEADTPTDLAIYKGQLIIANRLNLKHIICGGNMSSEGILPIHWHYNARDQMYTKSILRNFNVNFNDYASMNISFFEEFFFRIIKKIKIYSPLNYINYVKLEAEKELTNLYGWENFKSKHGESRFTRFLQTYYLYNKHGFDYRRAMLSCEICLKRTTRDDSIKILRKKPYSENEIEKEIYYIAKKLNISFSELKSIILMPAKWYTDFKNQEKILGAIYNIYRFIKNEVKASNF